MIVETERSHQKPIKCVFDSYTQYDIGYNYHDHIATVYFMFIGFMFVCGGALCLVLSLIM
jgi:hypothetical protein